MMPGRRRASRALISFCADYFLVAVAQMGNRPVELEFNQATGMRQGVTGRLCC
jgi:hypothetical protein